MKAVTRQLLISILLILFTSETNGQDNLDTNKLWRLADCIEYARNNNILITTQKLNTSIAGEQYLQAHAAVLPDLYGNANQNFSHTNNNNGGKAININGSLGFSSSLVLYRGGYLKDDIQQKNLQVESANLSIMERINDISVQVTQAFLTVLMDKENIIYYRDLANTSKAQLDRARLMFKVGSLSRKELVQAEAQLAQDQYSLTSVVNNERRDRISLKQLLQLSDTSFDIAKPDTIINAGIIAPLAETKSAAFATRPEIKNADIGVDIADWGLTKARALAKPSLNLSSGIGTSYSNESSSSIIRQFDDNFYQQVGLTLSVPIFTKRVNRTNINIAKIGVEQAKLNRDNTRTVLELDIERAFVNVVNAQGQYEAAVTQLSAAREVYHIANEELRIGSINRVELFVQRNQYIQALQNYLSAKYNAALAVRIYDFYRGIPITMD